VEQGGPRGIFSTPQPEPTKKFIASLSAPHSYDNERTPRLTLRER
jgi:cystine transport system ATP-binding protein